VRIFPLLDCVEERQHRAPRIADDGKRLEPEFRYDRPEVLDVGAPRDRNPRVRLRAPASLLVVKEQVIALSQVQHLRQQVTVVGARASVQNDQLWGICP